MNRLLPPLLALLVAPAMAADPTYRIVHPDGSVEFTDEPRPGAEEFTIPETQTFSPPPQHRFQPEAESAAKRASLGYDTFEISAPNPEETVRDARGNVLVAVRLHPELEADHQVVIVVDGEVRASGRTDTYRLTGIPRGAHTVSAQVRNAAGRVITSTQPITFYMHQPSALFPGRT